MLVKATNETKNMDSINSFDIKDEKQNKHLLSFQINNLKNNPNILPRRKSHMSFSKYNLDTEEENFEESEFKFDFEALKNYKIYFLHNNSDVVIEGFNKKLDEKRSLTVPTAKKRKKRGTNNVSFDLNRKNHARVAPKEKSFLATFLRKNFRAPTINNLIKGLA